MHRRRLFVAASGLVFAPAIVLTAAYARPEKKKLNTYIYRNALSYDAFPEYRIANGEKGLHARLIQAGSDGRVPAPKEAKQLLLVVYRLPVSGDPSVAWNLELNDIETISRSDHTEKRRVFDLILPPVPGDNVQRATLSGAPSTPGLVQMAAFWLDLSELVSAKILHPGVKLKISFGQYFADLVAI